MRLLDAAGLSPDWKPEMRDWLVTSYSARLDSWHGRQTVQMSLFGPWNVTQSNQARIEFEYDGTIPVPVGHETIASMDAKLCPAGAIGVWDERPFEYNVE
jgi:hypothetical protein